MKILLPVMSILMVLFLFSCKESEVAEVHDVQSQQQEVAVTEVRDAHPQQQEMAISDVHTVVVQEVIQGNSYTYLEVKEKDANHWIAISKAEMQTGETVSYKNPLEMRNFKSKELERTFEVIYFVGGIEKESSVSKQTPQKPHQKPAVEAKDIAIEPLEGGVSIAELFSKRDSYANKVVRIKGQVTKVNLSIMGKNWVHLQDGTGDAGNNDLLVTTQEEIALGDIVVFEGTIALNKDFGSGYSYEILMEEAKRLVE